MRLTQWLAVGLALAGILLVALAGPGTRAGLWDFRAGFALLRWGAYLGIAGTVLAIGALALTRPRGAMRGMLMVAALLGLAAVMVPWRWRVLAERLPAIHDISTDMSEPPQFDALMPLRADAPNPPDYGGPEIAQQQRDAYPDIQPLVLPAPPADVWRAALSAAERMGWKIVAADSAAGRIEATATTRWFGFKDDVVVRIRPDAQGTRVDVRSVSRVGLSDVGENARRIRAYLERLRAEIPS